MKGASLFISFVLLMLIVFGLALIIGPWIIDFSSKLSQKTENTTIDKITCQEAAYDFEPDYGIDGADWNFTGATDTLYVKIKNTGTQNLHNFSFELTIASSLYNFNVTSDSQKSSADPLKPSQSTILEANMTDVTNQSSDLQNIKVLNMVCPSVSVNVNV